MTVQRNAPSTGPPDAAIGTARPSQRLEQAGSSAAPAQAVKPTSGLIPAVPARHRRRKSAGCARKTAAPRRVPATPAVRVTVTEGPGPSRTPLFRVTGNFKFSELCRHSGGCGAASRLLRLCLLPLVPYKLRLYPPVTVFGPLNS